MGGWGGREGARKLTWSPSAFFHDAMFPWDMVGDREGMSKVRCGGYVEKGTTW